MGIRYLQSIGMSCQTRHQIERFAETPAARAAGIAFLPGPFDWLGASPLRIAGFLDAGLPQQRREAVVVRDGRAFLAEPGFHAVHAYRVKEQDGAKRLDIDATFARERDKFVALRQRFLSVDPSLTSFVLSNCQNNIVGDLYDADETEDYCLDGTVVDAVQASLERLLGAPCALLVVSRRDRFHGTPDRRVRFLSPDDTEWKGDDVQWNELLTRHLGLGREPTIAAAEPV